MKTEILITGATGTTGQYAIQHLLNKGEKVRAMVRTIDERSEKLEVQGVEIVKGDFFDSKALNVALEGIKRAYFLYPFQDHLPEAASLFAQVAKEKGVEMVVEMSQMGAELESTSPATQNHVQTESIFNAAEVGAVHIRPGLFAWNYLGFAAPTVADHNTFYYPHPEAKYTIVHPKDIGEVVAEILADKDKDKHLGQSYEVSGSQVYSAEEVTKDIAELIGHKVEYVPVSVDEWIDAVKDHPTINNFLAKHLREFSTEVAEGRFDKTTDVVKNITGHEPRSFKEYIHEYKEAFLPKSVSVMQS